MPKDKQPIEENNPTTRELLKATPELKPGVPPKPSVSLMAYYEDMATQLGSMCAMFEGEWKEFLENTNPTAPEEITNKLLNRMGDVDMILARLTQRVKAARTAIARQRDRYHEVHNLILRLTSEMSDDDDRLFPFDDNDEGNKTT